MINIPINKMSVSAASIECSLCYANRTSLCNQTTD